MNNFSPLYAKIKLILLYLREKHFRYKLGSSPTVHITMLGVIGTFSNRTNILTTTRVNGSLCSKYYFDYVLAALADRRRM